jgi:hypothetical protein
MIVRREDEADDCAMERNRNDMLVSACWFVELEYRLFPRLSKIKKLVQESDYTVGKYGVRPRWWWLSFHFPCQYSGNSGK